MQQWEKGSTPKKTHPPTHISKCSRQRHQQSTQSRPLPSMPKLCYRQCSLMAWLSLCHRFLIAYTVCLGHTKANIPSEPHHALHRKSSRNDPIQTLIVTISNRIDCKLHSFHLADNQFSNAIASLNLTCVDDNVHPQHIPDPIHKLIVTVSDRIDNKHHNFCVADLLLNNAITALDPTCDNDDNPK